jgi:hypothetical protein
MDRPNMIACRGEEAKAFAYGGNAADANKKSCNDEIALGPLLLNLAYDAA